MTTYRSMAEHRAVAAQMLGRPLTKSEVVHHIDGNGHNNDPANLQVMDAIEHLRLHATTRSHERGRRPRSGGGDRRLQIILTAEQYNRLAAEAERTGASMAEIIRRAIDAKKAKP